MCISHTSLFFILISAATTRGEYVIQSANKACTLDTVLTTIDECAKAKAALDPSASKVQREDLTTAPSGCSRWNGNWFFNSMTGKLDGASEPVCKAATETKTMTTTTSTAATKTSSTTTTTTLSTSITTTSTKNGKYVIQNSNKACSSDSMLATKEECAKAKAALDPSAPELQREDIPTAPGGCSRWNGNWFFNGLTGKLDGVSEPVCKAATTAATTTTTTASTTATTTTSTTTTSTASVTSTTTTVTTTTTVSTPVTIKTTTTTPNTMTSTTTSTTTSAAPITTTTTAATTTTTTTTATTTTTTTGTTATSITTTTTSSPNTMATTTATAGEYVIQDPNKACSSDTMLATLEECAKAKAALDPSASVVEKQNFSKAPGGCSRWQGKWFFNIVPGELDGASEPVCNADAPTGTTTTATTTAATTTRTTPSTTTTTKTSFRQSVTKITTKIITTNVMDRNTSEQIMTPTTIIIITTSAAIGIVLFLIAICVLIICFLKKKRVKEFTMKNGSAGDSIFKIQKPLSPQLEHQEPYDEMDEAEIYIDA